MRYLLISILVFIAGYAPAQTTISLPEPYGDNFLESELIQEVSFVPLKPEKVGQIAPDMEMKSDGTDFFILDHKSTQVIYRFGPNGELLNTIKDTQKGTLATQPDGPVLSNPIKFSLNLYKKQVEIYNFENSKINRYNYSGAYQGQSTPEINPSDFVRDATGNYWIYTGWNNKETQFRLLKADQTGKTIERKMRLVSKCMQTEGFAFYPTTKGICMWELLGNSTYMITGNVVIETFRFDFGTRNLLSNYHQLDPFDAFKIMNESGYYTLKKYIENENYAYFFLNFSTAQQKQIFHVIYKKADEQTFVYSENSAIGALDKAQYITENDELVFLVLPRKLKQLLKTGIEFVPAPFSTLDEDLTDVRDPIILKIKLGNAPEELEQTDESDVEN